MRKAVTLTFVLFLVLICGLDRDFSAKAPAPVADAAHIADAANVADLAPVAPAAIAVPVVPPLPGIDFICNCQVCASASGLGCRDLSTHRFTSCSAWWAIHSSECR